MGEKIGIDKVEAVLTSAILLGNAVGDSFEDGKFTLLSDGPKFLKFAMSLPAGLSATKGFIEQVKDIDPTEMATLKIKVGKEFDIPNDKLEVTIEEGLILMVSIYEYASKNFFKKSPE